MLIIKINNVEYQLTSENFNTKFAEIIVACGNDFHVLIEAIARAEQSDIEHLRNILNSKETADEKLTYLKERLQSLIPATETNHANGTSHSSGNNNDDDDDDSNDDDESDDNGNDNNHVNGNGAASSEYQHFPHGAAQDRQHTTQNGAVPAATTTTVTPQARPTFVPPGSLLFATRENGEPISNAATSSNSSASAAAARAIDEAESEEKFGRITQYNKEFIQQIDNLNLIYEPVHGKIQPCEKTGKEPIDQLNKLIESLAGLFKRQDPCQEKLSVIFTAITDVINVAKRKSIDKKNWMHDKLNEAIYKIFLLKFAAQKQLLMGCRTDLIKPLAFPHANDSSATTSTELQTPASKEDEQAYSELEKLVQKIKDDLTPDDDLAIAHLNLQYALALREIIRDPAVQYRAAVLLNNKMAVFNRAYEKQQQHQQTETTTTGVASSNVANPNYGDLNNVVPPNHVAAFNQQPDANGTARVPLSAVSTIEGGTAPYAKLPAEATGGQTLDEADLQTKTNNTSNGNNGLPARPGLPASHHKPAVPPAATASSPSAMATTASAPAGKIIPHGNYGSASAAAATPTTHVGMPSSGIDSSGNIGTYVNPANAFIVNTSLNSQMLIQEMNKASKSLVYQSVTAEKINLIESKKSSKTLIGDLAKNIGDLRTLLNAQTAVMPDITQKLGAIVSLIEDIKTKRDTEEENDLTKAWINNKLNKNIKELFLLRLFAATQTKTELTLLPLPAVTTTDQSMIVEQDREIFELAKDHIKRAQEFLGRNDVPNCYAQLCAAKNAIELIQNTSNKNEAVRAYNSEYEKFDKSSNTKSSSRPARVAPSPSNYANASDVQAVLAGRGNLPVAKKQSPASRKASDATSAAQKTLLQRMQEIQPYPLLTVQKEHDTKKVIDMRSDAYHGITTLRLNLINSIQRAQTKKFINEDLVAAITHIRAEIQRACEAIGALTNNREKAIAARKLNNEVIEPFNRLVDNCKSMLCAKTIEASATNQRQQYQQIPLRPLTTDEIKEKLPSLETTQLVTMPREKPGKVSKDTRAVAIAKNIIDEKLQCAEDNLNFIQGHWIQGNDELTSDIFENFKEAQAALDTAYNHLNALSAKQQSEYLKKINAQKKIFNDRVLAIKNKYPASVKPLTADELKVIERKLEALEFLVRHDSISTRASKTTDKTAGEKAREITRITIAAINHAAGRLDRIFTNWIAAKRAVLTPDLPELFKEVADSLEAAYVYLGLTHLNPDEQAQHLTQINRLIKKYNDHLDSIKSQFIPEYADTAKKALAEKREKSAATQYTSVTSTDVKGAVAVSAVTKTATPQYGQVPTAANTNAYVGARSAPNTNYEYQDHMIVKVWDAHIQKKQLQFYCGNNETLNTLFSGTDGMSLNKKAGLLIKKDGALYNVNNEYSLSICTAVDYANNTASAGENAVTASVQAALEQIKLWNQAHNTDDQKIIKHRLLFPYHCSPGHWNLGALDLFVNGSGKVTVAKLKIYEPLNRQPQVDQARELLKHALGLQELSYALILTQQQDKNDSTSCGAISAENGRRLIDASGFNKKYPIGAKELRENHITLVNNPRFNETQANNRVYTDPKAKFIFDPQNAARIFNVFINALDSDTKVIFMNALKNIDNIDIALVHELFVGKKNELKEYWLDENNTTNLFDAFFDETKEGEPWRDDAIDTFKALIKAWKQLNVAAATLATTSSRYGVLPQKNDDDDDLDDKAPAAKAAAERQTYDLIPHADKFDAVAVANDGLLSDAASAFDLGISDNNNNDDDDDYDFNGTVQDETIVFPKDDDGLSVDDVWTEVYGNDDGNQSLVVNASQDGTTVDEAGPDGTLTRQLDKILDEDNDDSELGRSERETSGEIDDEDGGTQLDVFHTAGTTRNSKSDHSSQEDPLLAEAKDWLRTKDSSKIRDDIATIRLKLSESRSTLKKIAIATGILLVGGAAAVGIAFPLGIAWTIVVGGLSIIAAAYVLLRNTKDEKQLKELTKTHTKISDEIIRLLRDEKSHEIEGNIASGHAPIHYNNNQLGIAVLHVLQTETGVAGFGDPELVMETLIRLNELSHPKGAVNDVADSFASEILNIIRRTNNNSARERIKDISDLAQANSTDSNNKQAFKTKLGYLLATKIEPNEQLRRIEALCLGHSPRNLIIELMKISQNEQEKPENDLDRKVKRAPARNLDYLMEHAPEPTVKNKDKCMPYKQLAEDFMRYFCSQSPDVKNPGSRWEIDQDKIGYLNKIFGQMQPENFRKLICLLDPNLAKAIKEVTPFAAIDAIVSQAKKAKPAAISHATTIPIEAFVNNNTPENIALGLDYLIKCYAKSDPKVTEHVANQILLLSTKSPVTAVLGFSIDDANDSEDVEVAENEINALHHISPETLAQLFKYISNGIKNCCDGSDKQKFNVKNVRNLNEIVPYLKLWEEITKIDDKTRLQQALLIFYQRCGEKEFAQHCGYLIDLPPSDINAENSNFSCVARLCDALLSNPTELQKNPKVLPILLNAYAAFCQREGTLIKVLELYAHIINKYKDNENVRKIFEDAFKQTELYPLVAKNSDNVSEKSVRKAFSQLSSGDPVALTTQLADVFENIHENDDVKNCFLRIIRSMNNMSDKKSEQSYFQPTKILIRAYLTRASELLKYHHGKTATVLIADSDDTKEIAHWLITLLQTDVDNKGEIAQFALTPLLQNGTNQENLDNLLVALLTVAPLQDVYIINGLLDGKLIPDGSNKLSSAEILKKLPDETLIKLLFHFDVGIRDKLIQAANDDVGLSEKLMRALAAAFVKSPKQFKADLAMLSHMNIDCAKALIKAALKGKAQMSLTPRLESDCTETIAEMIRIYNKAADPLKVFELYKEIMQSEITVQQKQAFHKAACKVEELAPFIDFDNSGSAESDDNNHRKNMQYKKAMLQRLHIICSHQSTRNDNRNLLDLLCSKDVRGGDNRNMLLKRIKFAVRNEKGAEARLIREKFEMVADADHAATDGFFSRFRKAVGQVLQQSSDQERQPLLAASRRSNLTSHRVETVRNDAVPELRGVAGAQGNGTGINTALSDTTNANPNPNNGNYGQLIARPPSGSAESDGGEEQLLGAAAHAQPALDAGVPNYADLGEERFAKFHGDDSNEGSTEVATTASVTTTSSSSNTGTQQFEWPQVPDDKKDSAAENADGTGTLPTITL